MLTQDTLAALEKLHFHATTTTSSSSVSEMATTHPLPHIATSHPENPVPEEPTTTRAMSVTQSSTVSFGSSPNTSFTNDNASEIDTTPSTPITEDSDGSVQDLPDKQHEEQSQQRRRRASTILVSQDTADSRLFLGKTPGAATEMIQKACCGGGCCMLKDLKPQPALSTRELVRLPQNHAYTSLNLRLNGPLGLESELTELAELPEKIVSFEQLLPSDSSTTRPKHDKNPPNFVKPHPPYDVFSAPLYHARELTKPGAEKRTFHFDIDVTDYPEEGGVDFRVGGAIGVCAPNDTAIVNQIFDRLGVPNFLRDKPVLLKTTKGRWPTIWGEDKPRELVTTRRELLTWCADVQSYPPTKALFRLLAEYASDAHEKQILLYLCSAQGQASFCDLRTGPYLTLSQLLHAFPSSMPPLDHLLSTLNQLMPRFYSLSQDPMVSCERNGHCHRIIEVAASVHESPDWQGGQRAGVGSGFLERCALQIIEAEKQGKNPRDLDIRIPMFRGLMSNPLAREYVSDGPMLLIGAGVGIAPFRGFVHRRLKSANCANKVWVLQGIRDSLVDELYAGDWGVHEDKVRKVVQSRRAESRYVQEEVRAQADLVWFIINALDGRVFVCGSSKGMGEGVEAALIDVVMGKGRLNYEEAKEFWDEKKASGQYIAETW